MKRTASEELEHAGLEVWRALASGDGLKIAIARARHRSAALAYARHEERSYRDGSSYGDNRVP